MRYLRLYLYFLRFSISRALEFRIDFFFRILMDFLYYSVNIALYKILFLHTPTLAGWTEAQAMVFVGAYLFVDALNMTIFSNNLWWFPIFVNRGDLDYYLVRPISSLFFLSLRDFAANSFVNLLMALAILSWALSQYPGTFTLSQLFLFFLLLLNGTFLYYILHMLFLIPVFWTHSTRGFDRIFHGVSQIMERPDGIFVGWSRKIVTTLLPFALIASFPTRSLFEAFSWDILIHIFFITTLFFMILLFLWGFALRFYSSASS